MFFCICMSCSAHPPVDNGHLDTNALYLPYCVLIPLGIFVTVILVQYYGAPAGMVANGFGDSQNILK